MRGHVPEPGLAGDLLECLADALGPEPPAVVHEQPRLPQVRRPAGDPLVQQLLELRVQRDVAVGAQLPERHVQPVRGADLHDRVDLQVQELAAPQAGAGEELDRESRERIVGRARGLDQLLRGAVVDEPRQRVIELRHVTGEHQRPRRGVLAVPLGKPLQADPQGRELARDRALRQPPAAADSASARRAACSARCARGGDHGPAVTSGAWSRSQSANSRSVRSMCGIEFGRSVTRICST